MTSSTERNNCARELNAIVMGRNESLENFIDRFNSLRRRAVDQVLPESLLAENFLCALPDVLSSQVSIAHFTRKSVPFLESAPRAPKRPVTSINQDDEFHQSSRLSRHASVTEAIIPSYPTHTRPVVPIRQAKARIDKYCTFRRAHTHKTSECRAANANNNTLPDHAPTDKECYTCGVFGWSRSHICNTSRRNDTTGDESPRDYHLGAMNFGPGRANNNYIADAVATAEYATSLGTSQSWENNANIMRTSSVSEPSLSTDTDTADDAAREIARRAQQCKFHTEFSLPPDNKSNMIIIPVIIQNIRTYAIIDTGATFSMIFPSFASFLGDSVSIHPSLGTVQLGHVDNVCNRQGNVLINLFYNNKTFAHTFEIFDFYKTDNNKHIPALIGVDLFHQLRIGLTGLALSHFDLQNNNPFPPSPADPISKPNSSPYGAKVERDSMMKVLNPLLMTNSKIDMKSTYCNLPGAVINLNTKPGCISFKKQYPLPFAYEAAVRKQISTRLNEGVIDVSTSHTGFNAPLLVVGRKNSDGIFTFDKIRLVTDVRNLRVHQDFNMPKKKF
ncbi:uncharacterized protein EV154DRAFT_567822 [Mucor mucedo]|uniref:uncharacterized protein n=1 Tax=Mucor mucedo TaxID=29922 RepID=UPI00221E640B|nr:uncharacterized protein EV154DRAFT_567822 [Mucor mucedo]KAI7884993.1 hypothetical protein EV154DRAFT_567822 [Mucor mucedo]